MRLLLGLVGCGNPISNEVFQADEEFLAALPGEDRIGFSRNYALVTVGDDRLLQNAFEEAEYLDQLVREPARITNTLRLTAPGERSATHRAWPARTIAAPDDSDADIWWVRANITRADEASDFTWMIEAAVEEDGPWREIGFGRHDPDGIGTFIWDYETQDQLLGARFPVRVEASYTDSDDKPREVEMTIPIFGGIPRAFVLVGDTVFGWAGLVQMTDDGQSWPGASQIYVTDDGKGRGQGQIQRGEDVVTFESCWSAVGDTVFASGDSEEVPQIGNSADCDVIDLFDTL